MARGNRKPGGRDPEDRKSEVASYYFQDQSEFAKAVIQYLVLTNGGAMIAIMTLLGTGEARVARADLNWSFLLLGAGLCLAIMSGGSAYMAQLHYGMHVLDDDTGHEDSARMWRLGAIVTSAVSILGFCFGCWYAASSIAIGP